MIALLSYMASVFLLYISERAAAGHTDIQERKEVGTLN